MTPSASSSSTRALHLAALDELLDQEGAGVLGGVLHGGQVGVRVLQTWTPTLQPSRLGFTTTGNGNGSESTRGAARARRVVEDPIRRRGDAVGDEDLLGEDLLHPHAPRRARRCRCRG